MPVITRTIWILSIVSMLADIASEMLYPVVPVYLKQIGFSFFLIGLLEGLAEFTAGLSKGYFGNLSDNSGKRLPFIRWGYFLSGLSKPMMAIFTFPLWIFSARTIDRLGKGLRTGARDAILSQETTPETKATVFGFHRGWDTAGAVLGPSLALIYLRFNQAHYRELFFFAFFPGMLAVASLFLLKEKKNQPAKKKKTGFFSFFRYWKESPTSYRKLVIGLLAFAFFNSSDVFLLLITKQITGNDTLTIGAYIFYNLVYALTSYPMGVAADKFGMKKVFVIALIIFAIVYGGFALAKSPWMVFGLFLLYGLYAAGTEGIAKALITNIADVKQTATAIGFYTSCQSIAALAASAWAGFLWSQSGPMVTFMFSAIGTLLVVVYLIFFFRPENKPEVGKLPT
ncbi:MAG: MFS transporter [Bacteroidetes bacterium]|nr:MAG: MFS transporter [Bacteroidota bacterium]